ncbi:acyl carrier protein [Verrucomicrobia bacterium]|nr:acyl carrier protein [Verrucomicrobiota bacterium]
MLMDTAEFVKNLKESVDGLQDHELTPDTVLSDLAEWDSLGVLSTISMVDMEYQVRITGAEVQDCRTIGDLAVLLEGKQ